MNKLFLLFPLLSCAMVYGQFNPKMRNNFGANHATFRINAGYYTPAARLSDQSAERRDISPAPGMLSNMRLNIESMVMVNNRYGFSESVSRNPAKFILGKMAYDGFTNTALASIAFAKSTKCRTTLPFFGQIKGFWGIGATARFRPNEVAPKLSSNIGSRLSLNVYNKTSALQAETYVFADGVIVNALVYKKISENFLVNAGVENNLPKLGLSALLGSSRLSVYTQLHKRDIQAGVHLAINL
jgi:hypothetical protein